MAASPLIKKLRYPVEAAILSTAIFVFRLVPVDRAAALMAWFWRKLAPLNSRHKRALRHLELAMPETTPEEREEIVLGMWDNLGRVAAETFHINELLADDSRFEVLPDTRTEAIVAANEPCIFVSLHTGNWEMCIAPAAQRGMMVTGVYQALKNPEADRILRDMRKDLYRGGLYSKGHQTARKLISTLRKGGSVGVMSDLRDVRGLKVPFFGREAYATPVPASLARTCGVPIIVGRVIRTGGTRFKVEGRAIEAPVTDDRKADIQAATEEIHRIFEEWIREHPEQWMWIHRKWVND